MMSEKDKDRTDNKIRRMVDTNDDSNRFGYRPPSMKAKSKKDTEEKGYVPPKKPHPPSGSDSSGDKKAK